jgi:hypothetical protein
MDILYIALLYGPQSAKTRSVRTLHMVMEPTRKRAGYSMGSLTRYQEALSSCFQPDNVLLENTGSGRMGLRHDLSAFSVSWLSMRGV